MSDTSDTPKKRTPRTPGRKQPARAIREKVAILIASGLKYAEIATIVDRKRSWVKALAITEEVRELVKQEEARQTARLKGSVDEAIDELKRGAPSAARRLVRLAGGDDLTIAERAARAVLDRAGVGARVKHDLTITDRSGATDDELWARLDEIRATLAATPRTSTSTDTDGREDDGGRPEDDE